MNLKKCPFCGSYNIDIKMLRGRRGQFVFCCCTICNSQGKTFKTDKEYYGDAEGWTEDGAFYSAIKAWNMRAGENDG